MSNARGHLSEVEFNPQWVCLESLDQALISQLCQRSRPCHSQCHQSMIQESTPYGFGMSHLDFEKNLILTPLSSLSLLERVCSRRFIVS